MLCSSSFYTDERAVTQRLLIVTVIAVFILWVVTDWHDGYLGLVMNAFANVDVFELNLV